MVVQIRTAGAKKHNYEYEEYLKENIVCGGDVELCAVASPVALHVVDLHTVAIGALKDQINNHQDNFTEDV